jgi:phospholipid transport system substrate-binding protein
VSSISPAEQKRFEGLLVEYLVDSFYAKIARGATATFDTAGVELVAESSDLAVDTVIEKPGSPPEEITWRLRPAEGGYKIVDVISEGISLAATHRAVFSAVMLVGGLPRLEAMLAARE